MMFQAKVYCMTAGGSNSLKPTLRETDRQTAFTRASQGSKSKVIMEMIMDKPVVLITGGLTGIGRAAAIAFARKGAKVVVAGRRDEAGKALVKELRSLGSEAEFINADVRKEEDIRSAVDKTVARFGRLDVAVNNAATEGQVGPITDQTAESYAATFDTNVLGVLLSMKH